MIDRAIVAAFECFATKCVLYSTLQRRTSNLVTHVNSLAVLNKRANSVKDGSFPENNQLLFEFGSPNIAKPFHPGNFRSTLLGSFLARLLAHQRQSRRTEDDSVVNDVIRLNYYGDWGQQFNLLLTYCKQLNEKFEPEIENRHDKGGSDPYLRGQDDLELEIESLNIEDLLQLYSKAFHLSQTDERFKQKCAETQTLMDAGDESCLRLWKIIQRKSLLYFNCIFTMFGIEFDQQIGESQYKHKTSTEEVVEAMKQSLQFTQDSNGSFCFKLHNGKPRKLSKRDRTSSTYLTRDVAAALDRINTFPRLNKLYYVVDKSQSQHFENLFFVLRNILQWKQKQPEKEDVGSRDLGMVDFEHVKFGRVIGMSARLNRTVSVEKVVAECEQRVMQKLGSVGTTKSEQSQFNQVAKKLALAALIVNCFSYKRMSDYRYDWDRVTSLKGVSGVYMLMTYARVSSLLRKATAEKVSEDSGIASNQELLVMAHKTVKKNAAAALGEEIEDLKGMMKPHRNHLSHEAICSDLQRLRDSIESHEREEKVVQVSNELIDHLINHQRTLDKCEQDLDPFYLCMYLHHLCRMLSRLYKVAPCAVDAGGVRISAECKQIRLNCFQRALSVLHQGLCLMGVTPLQKV